ncbi:MAG TPA: TolC family protein [Epsilonproteobacteria bacterium]|nr:TolC family protein [Campylobacterota bacterium]
MRILFFATVAIGLVHATSIQSLIDTSMKKHPSLQTIEHRLSSMDEQISLSQNFSNPDVSFTINDMPFDDFTNRRLEPMQYQALNFKQKFPWFGKLDARKTFTQAKKNVILDSLDTAKVKLAEEIRMTAYTIKELEARIHIVHKYIEVAKQNIKLYTSYASTDSMSHTNSMNASLLLTKVKIKAANYQSILKSQKARLAYLVQSKVNHVSDTLAMKKPKSLHYYLARIKNNPLYQMRLSQKSVADANREIQSLDTTPDPYVKVGYFNRTNFSDYASITIGASMPLYGSEKLKTEAARKEVLAAASASLDFKSSLQSEVESMYAKLIEARTIYNILHNETLPQLEHMFELTQASIQEGGDLFVYTNLLEQKLDLEEESISIKAEYLRTQAKLKSLIGEI